MAMLFYKSVLMPMSNAFVSIEVIYENPYTLCVSFGLYIGGGTQGIGCAPVSWAALRHQEGTTRLVEETWSAPKRKGTG